MPRLTGRNKSLAKGRKVLAQLRASKRSSTSSEAPSLASESTRDNVLDGGMLAVLEEPHSPEERAQRQATREKCLERQEEENEKRKRKSASLAAARERAAVINAEKARKRRRISISEVSERIRNSLVGYKGISSPPEDITVLHPANQKALMSGALNILCPEGSTTLLKKSLERLGDAGREDVFRQMMLDHGEVFRKLLKEDAVRQRLKLKPDVMKLDRAKAVDLRIRLGLTETQWKTLAKALNDGLDPSSKFSSGGILPSISTMKKCHLYQDPIISRNVSQEDAKSS